jgi:hypothetical protein
MSTVVVIPVPPAPTVTVYGTGFKACAPKYTTPPAPPPPPILAAPAPPPPITKISAGAEPLEVKVDVPTVLKIWYLYPLEIVIIPPVEFIRGLAAFPNGVSILPIVSMYGIKTPMQT